MSLSNPRPENPVKKFIKFKGSTGHFEYWDKEKGEKGENVEIPINKIGFLVLDELNTISGYHAAAEAGIHSNEISDLKHEILNVKVFKTNILISGLYENIKDNIKAIGGKFTKSVYAAMITEKNSLELVNFQFSGSAFKGWIDKTVSVQTQGVKVTGFTDGQTGATKYKIPVFETIEELSQDLWNKAIEMDKQLQEYLKKYKSLQVEKEAVDEAQEVVNNISKNGNGAITTEDILGYVSHDDGKGNSLEGDEDLPF